MFLKHPFKCRKLTVYTVAGIFLAISLFSGCELPKSDFEEASGREEESKIDAGPQEAREDGLDDISSGNTFCPGPFDDPILKYLGVEKHKILTEYGNPEDTGYYGGGFYLNYKGNAGLIFFFPSEHDDNSPVSSLGVMRGDIMGVRIGDTFSEIRSVWGEPIGIEYDEVESQQWGLFYSFENTENGTLDSSIWVTFFAESRESPTNYVLIKRE